MDDEHLMYNSQEDQEEAEEALSLSELPLNHHEPADSLSRTRRSASEPPDFFEFLTGVDLLNTSDEIMCSADDIFICGKLVPFKDYPVISSTDTVTTPIFQPQEEPRKVPNPFPLRSRSDPSSVHFQHGTKMKFTRSSRSLDGTTYARGTFGKTDLLSNSKQVSRPRWYVYMMFGIAKFPAEMKLRDIKTRQLRRSPSTFFSPPEAAVAGKLPVSHRQQNGWTGSWKLLKALSCKDHASVAVTTSFACLPQNQGFVSNNYSYYAQ